MNIWGMLKQRRKTAIIAIIIIIIIGGYVFLRGPYVSNFMKMAVLSNLQKAIGRHVIAQKIYLNLFPLFVEARGVKVFDEQGTRLFAAEKVKGYIGLSEIFSRRLVIERIVVTTPEVWLDPSQMDDIKNNLDKYNAGKNGLVNINLRAVHVDNGSIAYIDRESGYDVKAEGVELEAVFKENPEIRLTIENLTPSYKEQQGKPLKIKTSAVVGPDGVDFKTLNIVSLGSDMQAEGKYSKDDHAEFKVGLTMLVDSVKQWLSLKGPGDGTINANGRIMSSDGMKGIMLDLNVKGRFYLETLMEILGVSPDYDIKGRVDFDGKINGALKSIAATGSVRLQKGSLFGVKIDDLKSDVAYNNDVLSFKNGKGGFYGGRGFAEASLPIPDLKTYYLNVRFYDVNSAPIMLLVGLDDLPIPPGKLSGEFTTNSVEFDPAGKFAYKPLNPTEDPIGRIESVEGGFKINGQLVTLTEIKMSSKATRAVLNGTYEISSDTLNLTGNLDSSDLNELASPYFRRLRGRGEMEFALQGTSDEPLLNVKATGHDVSVDNYYLGGALLDVSYTKQALRILKAKSSIGTKTHEAEGVIMFPAAQSPFDFSSPVYDITASVSGGEINDLLNALNISMPLKGSFDARLSVKGADDNPEIAGNVRVSDAVAYGRKITGANFDMSYTDEGLKISNALVKINDQYALFEGRLGNDKSIQFKASSDGLKMSGLFADELPFDYLLRFSANGSGSLDNPFIEASFRLSNGKYKGKNIGSGRIELNVKDKNLNVGGRIMDDKIEIKGSVRLEGDYAWKADMKVSQGRYDFLFMSYFKKVPDDFLFSLGGDMKLSGNKDHVNAEIDIARLNINAYGQAIVGDNAIKLTVKDKKIIFDRLALRSGKSLIAIKGDFVYGESYNLTLDGTASLAPLAGFSDKIASISGIADFKLTVSNGWEAPRFNGAMAIANGLIEARGFSQRLSSINGNVSFEGDKAVLKTMEAKIGGGDIAMSGILNLKGLKVDKFYLDTAIENVSLPLSRKFGVNFGGQIVYRGTADSQDVTGNIKINRANYKERIEWKTWLVSSSPLVPKGKSEVMTESSAGSAIGLNVKIHGSEKIIVDNNIANAPLKVEMYLRGTVAKPLLFGKIETNEGKVFFRNSEFNIINARADYADADEAKPYIVINADTVIKGYHIWLNLEGSGDKFELSLISDPPLDEVEILGLVTLGDFGNKLEGIESGIGAAEATSFLTGKYQDLAEERMKEMTGLDRFQIDPYVSSKTGAVSPRVTASKKLAGEKLYVTYAATVGGANEQELKLEYLLGSNVSLLGGQDERGSLGGDLKFRFQFK